MQYIDQTMHKKSRMLFYLVDIENDQAFSLKKLDFESWIASPGESLHDFHFLFSLINFRRNLQNRVN